MKKLPISVVIATLNEEKNIGPCLDRVKANNPSEIIVVDGGSTDNTRKIVSEKAARLLVVDKLGVAFQQEMGIRQASCDFISIVDAFDRLESNCLSILLNEMKQYGYDAIQACPIVKNPQTYCQRAYAFNADCSLNKPGPTIMCGRPALFRAEKILDVGFDWRFFKLGVGCVDTDVSIRFEMKGYSQGKGTGITYRNLPGDWKTWLSKMAKYGRGDAHLIAKFPHKKRAIRKHQLFTYPVQRSMQTVIHGGTQYVPFFVLFGLIRFVSSLVAPWRT